MTLSRKCLMLSLVLLMVMCCSLVAILNFNTGDSSLKVVNCEFNKPEDFEGFNNITGSPCYIVPNYIHLVKFQQNTFSFSHAICVLAAFKNQHPEKIFIHTDVDSFEGENWDLFMKTPGFKDVLVINKVSVPTEIFGQPINKQWKYYHGGDVTRLRVLMEYGGIYLDNDAYIVQNLNQFRRYEMAMGWKPGKPLGNQVLIAHKNARFLRDWYNSYKANYQANKFFFNAGYYPAFHILRKRPYLIHRQEKLFGNYGPFRKLYLEKFPQWRNYYTIHTLSNHLDQLKKNKQNLKYPVVFNKRNIDNYPVAYRDLAYSALRNRTSAI